MKPLLCIGDIHGKFREYSVIAEAAENRGYNTLQIGDFGFQSTYATLMVSSLDPQRHRFFMGNHDAYNCNNVPHNIGNFGLVPDYPDIFFVRGGFSIDKKYRTAGVNWFPEEELRWDQLDECIELHRQLKPRVLISHEPPYKIGRVVGNSQILREFGFDPERFQSRTSVALQTMLNVHKPEVCIHGHFHIDFDMEFEGVRHVGLGELSTCLVPKGPTTGCGSSSL